MKKILVIVPNWLGDAIMASPAFKALKDTFAGSFVGVMAPRRLKGIFDNDPCVDEVIYFDEKKEELSLLAKISFVFKLRAKKFDTVFLIQRSFTRSLLCLLAGIQNRVGYLRKKNCLTINLPVTPPEEKTNRRDYYLGLFEGMGVKFASKTPVAWVAEKEKIKYKGLIAEIKRRYSFVAGINPSANWELKRWPTGNFSRLADKLAGDLNCAVILIGDKKEKEIIGDVTKKTRAKHYDLCGKTTLTELAGLMSFMDIFISNDSGPAHLAAAIGIPTIALFGPTSKDITAPAGKFVTILSGKPKGSCKIPCYSETCADNVCMKSIAVEEVLEKTKQILSGNNQLPPKN